MDNILKELQGRLEVMIVTLLDDNNLQGASTSTKRNITYSLQEMSGLLQSHLRSTTKTKSLTIECKKSNASESNTTVSTLSINAQSTLTSINENSKGYNSVEIDSALIEETTEFKVTHKKTLNVDEYYNTSACVSAISSKLGAKESVELQKSVLDPPQYNKLSSADSKKHVEAAIKELISALDSHFSVSTIDSHATTKPASMSRKKYRRLYDILQKKGAKATQCKDTYVTSTSESTIHSTILEEPNDTSRNSFIEDSFKSFSDALANVSKNISAKKTSDMSRRRSLRHVEVMETQSIKNLAKQEKSNEMQLKATFNNKSIERDIKKLSNLLRQYLEGKNKCETRDGSFITDTQPLSSTECFSKLEDSLPKSKITDNTTFYSSGIIYDSPTTNEISKSIISNSLSPYQCDEPSSNADIIKSPISENKIADNTIFNSSGVIYVSPTTNEISKNAISNSLSSCQCEEPFSNADIIKSPTSVNKITDNTIFYSAGQIYVSPTTNEISKNPIMISLSIACQCEEPTSNADVIKSPISENNIPDNTILNNLGVNYDSPTSTNEISQANDVSNLNDNIFIPPTDETIPNVKATEEATFDKIDEKLSKLYIKKLSGMLRANLGAPTHLIAMKATPEMRIKYEHLFKIIQSTQIQEKAKISRKDKKKQLLIKKNPEDKLPTKMDTSLKQLSDLLEVHLLAQKPSKATQKMYKRLRYKAMKEISLPVTSTSESTIREEEKNALLDKTIDENKEESIGVITDKLTKFLEECLENAMLISKHDSLQESIQFPLKEHTDKASIPEISLCDEVPDTDQVFNDAENENVPKINENKDVTDSKSLVAKDYDTTPNTSTSESKIHEKSSSLKFYHSSGSDIKYVPAAVRLGVKQLKAVSRKNALESDDIEYSSDIFKAHANINTDIKLIKLSDFIASDLKNKTHLTTTKLKTKYSKFESTLTTTTLRKCCESDRKRSKHRYKDIPEILPIVSESTNVPNDEVLAEATALLGSDHQSQSNITKLKSNHSKLESPLPLTTIRKSAESNIDINQSILGMSELPILRESCNIPIRGVLDKPTDLLDSDRRSSTLKSKSSKLESSLTTTIRKSTESKGNKDANIQMPDISESAAVKQSYDMPIEQVLDEVTDVLASDQHSTKLKSNNSKCECSITSTTIRKSAESNININQTIPNMSELPIVRESLNIPIKGVLDKPTDLLHSDRRSSSLKSKSSKLESSTIRKSIPDMPELPIVRESLNIPIKGVLVKPTDLLDSDRRISTLKSKSSKLESSFTTTIRKSTESNRNKGTNKHMPDISESATVKESYDMPIEPALGEVTDLLASDQHSTKLKSKNSECECSFTTSTIRKSFGSKNLNKPIPEMLDSPIVTKHYEEVLAEATELVASDHHSQSSISVKTKSDLIIIKPISMKSVRSVKDEAVVIHNTTSTNSTMSSLSVVTQDLSDIYNQPNISKTDDARSMPSEIRANIRSDQNNIDEQSIVKSTKKSDEKTYDNSQRLGDVVVANRMGQEITHTKSVVSYKTLKKFSKLSKDKSTDKNISDKIRVNEIHVKKSAKRHTKKHKKSEKIRIAHKKLSVEKPSPSTEKKYMKLHELIVAQESKRKHKIVESSDSPTMDREHKVRSIKKHRSSSKSDKERNALAHTSYYLQPKQGGTEIRCCSSKTTEKRLYDLLLKHKESDTATSASETTLNYEYERERDRQHRKLSYTSKLQLEKAKPMPDLRDPLNINIEDYAKKYKLRRDYYRAEDSAIESTINELLFSLETSLYSKRLGGKTTSKHMKKKYQQLLELVQTQKTLMKETNVTKNDKILNRLSDLLEVHIKRDVSPVENIDARQLRFYNENFMSRNDGTVINTAAVFPGFLKLQDEAKGPIHKETKDENIEDIVNNLSHMIATYIKTHKTIRHTKDNKSLDVKSERLQRGNIINKIGGVPENSNTQFRKTDSTIIDMLSPIVKLTVAQYPETKTIDTDVFKGDRRSTMPKTRGKIDSTARPQLSLIEEESEELKKQKNYMKPVQEFEYEGELKVPSQVFKTNFKSDETVSDIFSVISGERRPTVSTLIDKIEEPAIIEPKYRILSQIMPIKATDKVDRKKKRRLWNRKTQDAENESNVHSNKHSLRHAGLDEEPLKTLKLEKRHKSLENILFKNKFPKKVDKILVVTEVESLLEVEDVDERHYISRSEKKIIERKEHKYKFKQLCRDFSKNQDDYDFHFTNFEFMMMALLYEFHIVRVISYLDFTRLHGIGSSLCAYVFFTIFLEMPLFMVVIFFASYSKKLCLTMFECVPALKGLGYVFILMQIETQTHSISLAGLGLMYLYRLILLDTWTSCEFPDERNIDKCIPRNSKQIYYNKSCDTLAKKGSKKNLQFATQYYLRNILRRRSGSKSTYHIWNITVGFLWVVIFLVAANGISKIRKITIKLQIVCVVLLAIMALYSAHNYEVHSTYLTFERHIKVSEFVIYVTSHNLDMGCFSYLIWLGNLKPPNLSPTKAALNVCFLKIFLLVGIFCYFVEVQAAVYNTYHIINFRCVYLPGSDVIYGLMTDYLLREKQNNFFLALWLLIVCYLFIIYVVYVIIFNVDAVLQLYPNLRKRRTLVCGITSTVSMVFNFILLNDPNFSVRRNYSLLLLNNINLFLFTWGIYFIYSPMRFADDFRFTYNYSVGKYWNTTWDTIPYIILINFIITLMYTTSNVKSIKMSPQQVIYLLVFPTLIMVFFFKDFCTLLATKKLKNISLPDPAWGPYEHDAKKLRRYYFSIRDFHYRHVSLNNCKHKCLVNCSEYKKIKTHQVGVYVAKIDVVRNTSNEMSSLDETKITPN